MRSGTNGNVELYVDASSKRVFQYNSGTFTAPGDYDATLVKSGSGSSEIFTLTHRNTGDVYIFYGLHSSVAPGHTGRLQERTSRGYATAGISGIEYTYNTDGSVNQVTLPQGWTVDYDYHTTGSEAGLLEKIELKDGALTVIKKVEYLYYDTAASPSSDIGDSGDLVQVKRSTLADDGTWMERYTQYRYYRWSGDGRSHQLKMVLNASDIDRIVTAGNSLLNTPEKILQRDDDELVTQGFVIEDYASRVYTYYTSNLNTGLSVSTPWGTQNLQSKYGGSNMPEVDPTSGVGRVKTVSFTGGCGGCGGSSNGAVKRTYFYLELNNGSSSDINDTVQIIVADTEDRDGGEVSRRLYGLNDYGVKLRDVLIENPNASTLKSWCRSVKLDATNRRIQERRLPSAHSVENDGDVTDFLDGNTGTNDNNTLHTSAGKIFVYGYNTNGDRDSKRVKKGRNGSAHYVWSKLFGTGSSVPTYLPTEHRAYRYPTTNSAYYRATTKYGYTFHDSGLTQIKTVETTLPTVYTSHNGSGSPTKRWVYYDSLGRLRWSKNGEGYVRYFSYDPDTGRLAFLVNDVKTATPLNPEITAGSAGKWEAWSGAAGLSRNGGLPTPLEHVHKAEYDDLGRGTLQILPDGSHHYTVYEANRTLFYPYWNSTTSKPEVAIRAVLTNGGGQVIERYTLDPDRTKSNGGIPTGLLTGTGQSHYLAWTKYTYDTVKGNLKYVDRYHLIPNTGNGNHSTYFHRIGYDYDTLGRPEYTIQQVSGAPNSNGVEQVHRYSYDILGRVTEVQRGVSAAGSNLGTTADDYDNLPSLSLTKVSEIEYDDGGVGDGDITRYVNYHGTGTNDYFGVKFAYDYRGRLRGAEPFYRNGSSDSAVAPFTVRDVNWRGRQVAVARYSSAPNWSSVVGNDNYAANVSTARLSLTKTLRDYLNRPYEQRIYSVAAGQSASKYLLTEFFYDRDNRLVGVAPYQGAATEIAYDGVGRQYQRRTTGKLEGSTYSSGKFQYRLPLPDPSFSSDDPNAMADGNENVFSITHRVFDVAGNIVELHKFEKNHDDTNGLDIDATTKDYVRQSTFIWYDTANRPSTMADYGSGDTSAGDGTWKYSAVPNPSEPSASNDLRIVTQYTYDDSGRLDTVTRWKDSSTAVDQKAFYDDLGRLTYVVDNYDSFSPVSGGAGPGDKDRVLERKYNGLDLVYQFVATNGNGDQVTKYLFEDSVNANRVTNVIYPDSNDTNSSGSDQVKWEYNVDGKISSRTDPRGAVLEFVYDGVRSLVAQKATTLGGADGRVRSITRDFDDLGRMTKLTSHGNLTHDPDNTTNVKNQIVFAYNNFGQMTQSQQDHDGVVNSGTPKVQYGYDATLSGSRYSRQHRLESVTFPNGRKVFYDYLTSSADRIYNRLGRVRSLRSTTITGQILATYDYSGTSRLVKVEYPTPDVALDLHQGTTNTYVGFDRFGRVKDHLWDDTTSSTDIAKVKYGYDYLSNRKWSEDVVAANNAKHFDEYNNYDDLLRLIGAQRGNLNSGKNAITSNESLDEDWTLDARGNWTTVKREINGVLNLDHDRSHNNANEFDEITTTRTGTVWADPAQDAAGNITAVPQPAFPGSSFTLTYDAWNRLVKVEDGSEGIAQYQYDALSRRIVKIDDMASDTYDYYYNAGWQVIEVRLDGVVNPLEQNVWHPYYVDSLAVRFYDENVSGSAIDEQYFTHDANFNVSSIVDTGGNVLERYAYSPYGELTVLDSSFVNVSGNQSSVDNSYTYTGRRYDKETGFYYYRNRYYHAQLGRFVNRDPIGYIGSQWNLYEYVGGNSFAYVDPYGLIDVSIGLEEDAMTTIAGKWNALGSDESFTLDPNNPDWQGANNWLDGIDNDSIDNLIISGHGHSGGAGPFNDTDLKNPNSDLSKFVDKLKDKMKDDGRIEFRACDVAAGQRGKDFICKMAKDADCDVCAYDDWYAVTPHGGEFTAHPNGSIDQTGTHKPWDESILNSDSGWWGTKPDKPKPKAEKPSKPKPNVGKPTKPYKGV